MLLCDIISIILQNIFHENPHYTMLKFNFHDYSIMLQKFPLQVMKLLENITIYITLC